MSPGNSAPAGSPQWRSALVGLVHALLASLLLSFLVGGLLHFTALPERLLPSLSLIILLLSLFWGGCQAARVAGSRGLVLGLEVGLGYFLLSLAVILAFGGPGLTGLEALRRAAFTLLGGALGGIFGVAWFQR